ncbi:progestin and adipoQ receptor family member 3-like isoform X2 [Varroa destructor]|uniref:Uncharacterized protein n=1 Tax=Varroa destructor TaxID=109461 RepID=A0A7M7L3X8_VARDE|nr:progestin and adipoQ receptor family member 3-like isoform X2 [Varroa destructor]
MDTTQTIQRTMRRRSTGSFFKDLAYFGQRILRTPSSKDLHSVCGRDKDCSKLHICSITEAPPFLTSNSYITHGYRTFKSKERCIKGILLWTNETVNIWTHLGSFFVVLALYVQDVITNYDVEGFAEFDRRLSGLMLASYLIMLGLSSVYHIFNCCCSPCYRYWYGWDFVGVCASIYGYGCGFLFLQFRDEPLWIAFYGTIKTVIAGVPICMTFSTKYFQERYDDSRSVWIGGFVAFNVLPIVHSILMRDDGLGNIVVQYTLPTHLIVMFLLVGSYIIYCVQFPESRQKKTDVCNRIVRFMQQTFSRTSEFHRQQPSGVACWHSDCSFVRPSSLFPVHSGIQVSKRGGVRTTRAIRKLMFVRYYGLLLCIVNNEISSAPCLSFDSSKQCLFNRFIGTYYHKIKMSYMANA